MFGKVFVMMGKNIFFLIHSRAEKKYQFEGWIVQTHNKRIVIFKFIVKYIWKWLLTGQLFVRTHLKIQLLLVICSRCLPKVFQKILVGLIWGYSLWIRNFKLCENLMNITKTNRSNEIFCCFGGISKKPKVTGVSRFNNFQGIEFVGRSNNFVCFVN